ncbi:VOC family protein [Actinospica sp. MGRD01-02]|uniref:VOC family protein n=1 Tax=Actinospica acidithermotolerans TaxID=2828514 RepID=A0A941EA64_9ACTN|nr:VOC family protein [Actinospica acidithermotolerans]MBR7825354.1 VOC family protein [Actinospica acidithermotolerans]
MTEPKHGALSQHGALHHVELWTPDLARAVASFGWLLEALGYAEYQNWEAGRSWRLGATYIVVEQSPAMSADGHDRLRPGLNHLAFHVEDAAAVETLASEAARHGWRLMFPDSHPHAGGEEHYAAYLENEDGFEVELVAAR